MHRLGRILVTVLAVIGSIVVAGFAVSLAVALLRLPAPLPGRIVLATDLDRGIIETLPDDPLARLELGEAYVLRDLVDALARAAGDDRVLGLVVKTGGAPIGLASVQEVRDSILAFRGTGKFAVAFAKSFGGFGAGGSEYYLATAADEVWLQPSGEVGIAGVLLETPFVRGTLEKLDIHPRLDQRHEHKTVMNIFTDVAFTPLQREALQAFVDSLLGRMVGDMAKARGLATAEVRALVDRGPFLAGEAKEAGLVDRLGYQDEALEAAKERAGEAVEFVDAIDYLERAGRPERRGPKIALVYGTGAIHAGMSAYDPLAGEPTLGADSVTRGLAEAVEDEEVRAIVLRVDSPGGGYVAADAIWRAVAHAREKGKPVVASFGDFAASGGYFVAMGADRIVASPGTVTGSIGVVAGKVVTEGFFRKLGVTWDRVQAGENAAMWSMLSDFTPEQWARFQEFLDRAYDDFVTKAGEGRGLTAEALDRVARGRVWTGEDAVNAGLVDELGGLARAVVVAKELIDLAPGEPARLVEFPRPVEPLIKLIQRLVGGRPTGAFLRFGSGARGAGSLSAGAEDAASLRSAIGDLRRLLDPLAERAGPFAHLSDTLRMPAIRIVH